MSSTTMKSGPSPGAFPLGNGSSPHFPLLDLGKFSRISDFTIHPPHVKLDPDLQQIVERESAKLRMKNLKYSSTNEMDWQLQAILQTSDGAKDAAKTKLTQDGKSAVISEVSKAINASSIDHSSKYLLSNEPLYVYALSYAFYFEKVPDAEGINDRVIHVAEHKIKPFFNRVYAEKVILDNHLDLTESQKKKIYYAAENTPISYLAGEPLKAINKIISKYVDYGNLHALVDKFFESGEIDPAKGTPQIRQLMVNHLIEIGLQVTLEETNTPDQPAPDGLKSVKATK